MKLTPVLIILSVMLISSCTHEIRPIAFGKDNCEQCRMTVMDPQFGAAILTSKGKTLTFDSGECMVRYVKSRGKQAGDQYYVSDYTQPGTLHNVMTATFLHGENIQSPMGGNLAAFTARTKAQEVMQETGGQLLTWDDLIRKQ